MECQRRSLRLTDQALVAVELALLRAEPGTVVDLLLGLAEEQEGAAGILLRQQPGALVRLTQRGLPPRLAPLDVALAWAAADAEPRPASTLDLLAAVREVGGAELRDLLEAVGLDVEVTSAASGETYGLSAPDRPTARLSVEAELAIARARAAGDGAVDLLAGLVESDALRTALDRVLATGLRERAGARWDLGVDAVVAAAHLWRGDEPVTAADLLRAAIVAGGEGPAAVLAEIG